MKRARKEDNLPLPPVQHPITEIAQTPVEEPNFYGEDFAVLINSDRKMGTLREKSEKRAGLKKGMRIMSHVKADAGSTSTTDIELVILNVYHGRLSTVFANHKLEFYLDGIMSEEEAIKVLQKFSSRKINRMTEIDYFAFIRAEKFDQLNEFTRQRLLETPFGFSLSYPYLARLYYPSFCQTLVWHGAGFKDWLDFLVYLRTIDDETAHKIYHYPTPGYGFDTLEARDLFLDPEYGLQFLLDEHTDKEPDPLYHLAVLCDIDTAEEQARLKG